MSAQPPAGSAAAAAASSTVDDPIDVDVEDNAMEDDEAQEEEEEEEDEDVSMDAISDDGVDTEQPIDADLFRRLARDAAQLHTETAYDPEMEDEQGQSSGARQVHPDSTLLLDAH
jgi:hypothetical protein